MGRRRSINRHGTRRIALEPRRDLLLQLLEEAFVRKSWHGTNLRGSIRGLSADLAGWRPGPGRRNIAEIVAHAAYWKYAVRRRLTGAKRGSFVLKGSNWFPQPEPISAPAWGVLVRLLDREHALLRQALAGLSTPKLDSTPRGRQTSTLHLLRGIALHDVYHTGQIQTIKALYRDAQRR
jgi:uncharacterized damage-inducible protein DinB